MGIKNTETHSTKTALGGAPSRPYKDVEDIARGKCMGHPPKRIKIELPYEDAISAFMRTPPPKKKVKQKRKVNK